ncbi:MAG: nucleoside 2-deoxyribosyltransferase domain-containing protein [Verrucomicrobiota bacterium]
MKGTETIAVIERFFLDVIGCVLPGLFLILLTNIFLRLGLTTHLCDIESINLLILLGVAYLFGHFLTFVGESVTEPVTSFFGNLFRSILNKIPCINLPRNPTSKELQKTLLSESQFQEFLASIKQKNIVSDSYAPKRANELRNLALSIEGVDKNLAHRFMILALFNITSASAILISVAAWMLVPFLSYTSPNVFLLPTVAGKLKAYEHNWIIVALSLWVCFGLINRYRRFYSIAFRMPISDALMKIGNIEKSATSSAVSEIRSTSTIYLAGGFHSGWQDIVILNIHAQVNIIDPRSHKIQLPSNYTAWDLEAIDRSDIIFAYLEATNPAGYALACEIGYARAMGKLIVFITDEIKCPDTRSKYYEMIRECAAYSANSLDEGVTLLNKILELRRTK